MKIFTTALISSGAIWLQQSLSHLNSWKKVRWSSSKEQLSSHTLILSWILTDSLLMRVLEVTCQMLNRVQITIVIQSKVVISSLRTLLTMLFAFSSLLALVIISWKIMNNRFSSTLIWKMKLCLQRIKLLKCNRKMKVDPLLFILCWSTNILFARITHCSFCSLRRVFLKCSVMNFSCLYFSFLRCQVILH